MILYLKTNNCYFHLKQCFIIIIQGNKTDNQKKKSYSATSHRLMFLLIKEV